MELYLLTVYDAKKDRPTIIERRELTSKEAIKYMAEQIEAGNEREMFTINKIEFLVDLS